MKVQTFLKLLLIIIMMGLSGCATFNVTPPPQSSEAGIVADSCLDRESHDDIVANTGFEIDACTEGKRIQGVLAEIPDDFWSQMYGYTAAGHHGVVVSRGKAYRAQWLWAGITGNGQSIPFRMRLQVIIEGMDTFDPDAHGVIMDARGQNAYDLHGNRVPGFTSKDYREGRFEKVALLGESAQLGKAVAAFSGDDLNAFKRDLSLYMSRGRVDFTDPHTGKKFSIATPFDMTQKAMQEKMRKLAAINNVYSLNDRAIAAFSGFSLSPSLYGMALSVAFVAWDFVMLDEVTPGTLDAVTIMRRMQGELQAFATKLAASGYGQQQ